MAEQFVSLALQGAAPVINNYESVYEKTKQKVKPVLSRKSRKDDDQDYDDYYPDQARKETQRYYPSADKGRDYYDDKKYTRARSVGGNDRAFGGGGRNYERQGGRKYDYSDSESSLSPPPRRRRERERERQYPKEAIAAAAGGGAAGALAARDRDERNRQLATYPPSGTSQMTSTKNGPNDGGGNPDESYSDSDSSSSVPNSSEDERMKKKARRNELITAGLAAVATVHAASGLYASMEARDKRHAEVENGTLSPEEARKERNKARLQDVAAIGIAALGIKGAYSKWQTTHESHKQTKQIKETRKQRHEKRVAKWEKQQAKARKGDSPPARQQRQQRQQRPGYGRAESSYRHSDTDLNKRYKDYDQPRYNDGNPYGQRY